jgi:hypothetical protein
MSIVLSYVDTEKAIVASDGLVSNENKDAVFCNEIKVFRINQNVLLGFAGHLSSCLKIADRFINPSPENKPIIDIISVNDAGAVIQNCIASLPNLEKCAFLVCGKGDNGKPCSACITSDGEYELKYATIPGQVIYYALCPDEFLNGAELFKTHILQHQTDIKYAMQLTIDKAADISPTVNYQHYFQEIYF